jgi:hypothetical protein
MTNYLKFPTWADSGHIHVMVETPRGSHAARHARDPDHNLTSADVYFERGETILNRRRQIKLKTIATAA